MKLRSAQKKGLSEFFNSVSVAWFAVGVIAPVFLPAFAWSRFVVSAVLALTFVSFFLGLSLQLLRRVR
jgi:hypothetical protein